MNVERLVHMANQISLFFESRPSEEEAISGIADHLLRFWDPRMRARIIEHVASGGTGLRERAASAVQRLAAVAPPC